MGALLHDIGKGRPGDHTDVGMELVRDLGPRMGFDDDDTETLVDMVRHHLLLPDVATRRDLDDPATAEGVAEKVGSVGTLRLLHGLTVADSAGHRPRGLGGVEGGPGHHPGRADGRGPRRRARRRCRRRPSRAPSTAPCWPRPAPSSTARATWSPSWRRDRPGLLRRVAGVMALHGLEVLSVEAVTSDEGWALERVTVAVPGEDPIPWPRIEADLEAGLAGRLAIRARLADRARTHRPRHRLRSARTLAPEVRVDNEASREATVLEVHADDATGLLERVCRAMAEMDLDVRSAKVQTLGDRVVDAFYVRGADGAKVTDDDHLSEVRRAILHSLAAG